MQRLDATGGRRVGRFVSATASFPRSGGNCAELGVRTRTAAVRAVSRHLD
jgi:hypothetical protein